MVPVLGVLAVTCSSCGNEFLDDAIFCRKCGTKRERAKVHVDPDDDGTGAAASEISLTLQLISGEVVARMQVSSASTVVELKEQLKAKDGTLVKHQRILFGTRTLREGISLRRQGVTDGTCLTLIRLSPSLPEQLQATAEDLRAQTAEDAVPCGNDIPVSGADSALATSHPAGKEDLASVAQGVAKQVSKKAGLPTPATPTATTPTAATPAPATPAGATATATSAARSEPAAHLLYGAGSQHLSAAPRLRPALPEMVRALRAASAEVSAMQRAKNLQELCPSGQQSLNLQAFSEPAKLDLEAIQSLRIPLQNLAAARRAMAAGECSPAVEKFVNIMHVFYNDFVPLRAEWVQALVAVEEARQALQHAEEVVAFASSLKRMDRPPQSTDVDGVVKATVRSLDQVQLLAKQGLALPAVHVEYVRMAIDSAGAHLLANPPCADPANRIRWSEAAMAIQLAPLPHFGSTLAAIARGIDCQGLQALSREFEPATECVRLLGAVIWVVQADCRCNPSWSDIKSILAKPQEFVDTLAEWSPIRDTSVARITHARGLLLGIWGWVAFGCGGSKALGTIFAWVSLTVTLLPLSEMAQRLTPVYKAVKQGITKSERAPPEQQYLAKAKAWTAALFLLDGPGEHWWWLRLIRPSADMDMPWTDGEDGGVGEAHPHEVHIDDGNPARWDPSGLMSKPGLAVHALDTASPADESLQGSVDFNEEEEDPDRDMVGADLGKPDRGEPEKEVELTQDDFMRQGSCFTDVTAVSEAWPSAMETPEAELAERHSSLQPSEPAEPVVGGEEVCLDCGNEYAPDAIFCRKCGRRREVALEEASPGPDAAELAAAEPQAAETAASEAPPGQTGA